MSNAITATSMDIPDVPGMSEEEISGTTEWHENDPEFKTLIREMEDYYEQEGIVFKIEDHFSVVTKDGKTYYSSENENLVDTAKEVFSNNIGSLEKKAEELMNRMNDKNELFTRIVKIESGLRSLLANAKDGPVRIDTDSDLYKDVKKLLDDINKQQGTSYRLEDFGTIETRGGKSYFVFDKDKLSGKDGLLSVLDRAADAVMSVNNTDQIELQMLMRKIHNLYNMWSALIKRIGEAMMDVNRSTSP